MISQLKVSFFHYLYKKNGKGEAPIFCKIVLDDLKKHFSTSVYCKPEQWDKDSQRVKGVGDEALLINRKLQEIYSQFIRIEKQLYEEGEQVSLQAIYDRYRGKTIEHTLCSVFEERITRMKTLVGIEYTHGTYQKFTEVYAHVKRFIPIFNQQQDIPLKHLNYIFIKGYEEYLLEKRQKSITINKNILRLRQMVLYGVKCGYIHSDPFHEYKPLKEKKHLVFLTKEELEKLEKYHFAQNRLEQVKNIYLFSVYTGLAYHETQDIQHKHIIKGFDGRNWIHLTRKKTDHEVSIPLLPWIFRRY